ncbi:unnamed protein product [Clonostachys rhizophaga]|uniref:Probable dipeptidyl-aminopeptidase B n=1 Tax=Clonostachys rhizophaga TaxID=160324 RepID=A0A9N9YXH4_9HYPO|nr:unnamed protein product [Clonostachys rhizophaga]
MALYRSFAAAALLLSTVANAIDPPRNPWQPVGGGERLLQFNQTVPSRAIAAKSTSVSWSAAGSDGQFITSNSNGDLVLEDIVSGNTETFVTADKLPSDTYETWISDDTTRVLVASNYTKQYRHSYFADYFVLDVESGELTALVDDQVGDIQYAVIAPSGDKIAFVRGNNLFLRDHGTGEIKQITTDGGPDQFHAVPDWVYEEEIFGTTNTLWFSPDAKFIAFLSFNETGVETYTIPYYMDNQKIAPVYPKELDLRYPKVGTKNPTVELNILDVESGEYKNVPITAFEAENLVVGEVAWVTDTHTALIYRAFNRVQDQDKHVLVDPTTLVSQDIRERDGSDGWLENTLSISYVGAVQTNSSSNASYYVDVSDQSGWNHIYLYPVRGGDAIQLTDGEWEVASILKVDTTRGLVYYTATTHHPTERHVYKVSLKDGTITPLVDDKVSAYWSASFSTGGGYYILSYQGPDVPYQELYATNGTSKPLRTIEDNAALYKTIAEYNLPNITYFDLEHPDGYKLSVKQQLPPNFDPSKKYPVLFTPYGGPNSQQVARSFQAYNWNQYISSDPELQYVTFTVDNRGTGYRGRAYRSLVTGQLGKLEPVDQIWAAEHLAERFSWINVDKIGIWGWSYGGYLAAKTLEINTGIFSTSLITAPVSDWRFYDSLYTERYMKTLEDNEAGYLETRVHDTSKFKTVAGGFSILHGTGDDNVHYQHAAALIDLLVGEGVTPDKMKMFAFTDSTHGITYNGASLYIYRFLTARLFDEVNRKVDATALVHQWSKRQLAAE